MADMKVFWKLFSRRPKRHLVNDPSRMRCRRCRKVWDREIMKEDRCPLCGEVLVPVKIVRYTHS